MKKYSEIYEETYGKHRKFRMKSKRLKKKLKKQPWRYMSAIEALIIERAIINMGCLPKGSKFLLCSTPLSSESVHQPTYIDLETL